MKTILLTGATSGIGWATALKFNQPGFRLILCGRRLEKLTELQKLLQVPVQLLNVDIRDYSHLTEELAKLPPEFSEVDILINNAAGIGPGRTLAYDSKLEDWEMMVDTNIKGLMGYTLAVLPQMVARNAGHIINVGSIAATSSFMGGHVYGGTKAFVHQFSRNLRNDLVGTHVRVSVVSPARVNTDFGGVKSPADHEGKKILEPEDVAGAIFWVTQQPPHVNVNLIELMSICQSPGDLTVKPLKE